jgi:hypothetical protein
MAIVINGSGTVTGISVGGLPDGVVDSGTLASNAVTNAKITDGAVDAAALATNSVDSAELVDGSIDPSHLPAGTPLQTVQGTTDATSTTTTTTYTVTDCSVAITPKHADSKFLLSAVFNVGTRHHDLAAGFSFADSLVGNTTAIAPDATTGDGSNRYQAFAMQSAHPSEGDVDNGAVWQVPFEYLYTPSYQNTTARTFYVLWKNNYYQSAGLIISNMNNNENDARDVRMRSTITVTEIKG